jgi:hypothetical protein
MIHGVILPTVRREAHGWKARGSAVELLVTLTVLASAAAVIPIAATAVKRQKEIEPGVAADPHRDRPALQFCEGA